MIRVILRGRTGNILFQYAFGRCLAEMHGVPLALDASWYNRDGWREVSHFLEKPLKAEVLRIVPIATRVLRKLTGKHYWQYMGFPTITEARDNHSFRKEFLDTSPNSLLFGYFQSPRYFDNIADELRSEIRELISTDICDEDISSPNSISVHVRRGDFIKIPVFNVCDDAYYRKSIIEMRARVENARFFIFSDDPDWCRVTFQDDDCHVVDSRLYSHNPLHDLHAMSLARHHIIANSSYSWWAAWLAAHPHQHVIMPDRWFNGEITAPIDEKKWITHSGKKSFAGFIQ